MSFLYPLPVPEAKYAAEISQICQPLLTRGLEDSPSLNVGPPSPRATQDKLKHVFSNSEAPQRIALIIMSLKSVPNEWPPLVILSALNSLWCEVVFRFCSYTKQQTEVQYNFLPLNKLRQFAIRTAEYVWLPKAKPRGTQDKWCTCLHTVIPGSFQFPYDTLSNQTRLTLTMDGLSSGMTRRYTLTFQKSPKRPIYATHYSGGPRTWWFGWEINPTIKKRISSFNNFHKRPKTFRPPSFMPVHVHLHPHKSRSNGTDVKFRLTTVYVVYNVLPFQSCYWLSLRRHVAPEEDPSWDKN